jgi:hypothetical protein
MRYAVMHPRTSNNSDLGEVTHLMRSPPNLLLIFERYIDILIIDIINSFTSHILISNIYCTYSTKAYQQERITARLSSAPPLEVDFFKDNDGGKREEIEVVIVVIVVIIVIIVKGE